MPVVDGKHYAYTRAGKKAAVKARKKKRRGKLPVPLTRRRS